VVDAIYSALSGLQAFGKKLGVTAHNVANIDTDGFKKSRAIFEEASPSGVTVQINRIESPGSPIPSEDETGEPRESSNVAVEEEMVNLITTRHGYTANLKTIKVEEELLGTLLDVLD
jgi:flagellar hook protein FlgE